MEKPIDVDLRLIVGEPVGNLPIMIKCPLHNDPNASLEVRRDHLYCHGTCQRFIRRYAGAALLLGLWDGAPETELAGVRAVKPLLGKYKNFTPATSSVAKAAPLDLSAPETFHRYLLSQEDTLAYFMAWRGMTEETIHVHQFGYTGSHFTIPVLTASGTLLQLRYRQDDRQYGAFTDRKYTGLTGHNDSRLYSLRQLCHHPSGTLDIGAIWIFEGEYDSAVGTQLGAYSITLTNGAGQLVKIPPLLNDMGIKPQRWIIATDQDEAGDKAAYDLQKLLGQASTRAVWASKYKDISEYNKAGGTLEDISLEHPLTRSHFIV
jgi:Toprim-like